MKKSHLITLFILALSTMSFAQDYEVRSIELDPTDMFATHNKLRERPNGGEYCAVFRIITQNISAKDRDLFRFNPDAGSYIAKTSNEDGKILLWVSPGINSLRIDNKELSGTRIYIHDYLSGEVESLKTYNILIVGTREIAPEPKGFGSCNIVFRPSPNDAVIYLNGEPMGTGEITASNIIAGTYQWSMEHPLYHTESGTVKLVKGQTDTVHVALTPAYGYMRIIDDYGLEEDVKVYLDGKEVGKMPYESDKLVSGMYRVAFEKDETLLATGQIEVKDNHISIEGVKDLFKLYQFKRQYNNPENDSIADSLSRVVHTRFEPIKGTVTIRSTPESTVIIDGTTYGRTPITISNIAVGMHDLELSSSGCTTLTDRISVKEGEEIPYLFQLSRACFLTITSDEDGDVVHIDGEYAGRTPITKELPFGTHSIAILRIGKFPEKTITVNLTPEEPERTISLSFGQLINVEADTDKNRVYVDGEYMGKTPIDIYLPYGKHTIRAERGWKSGSKRVDIKENQSNSNISINTIYEKPKAFLSNGAFFMTGNVAMIKSGQPVYGFNIGDICNGGNAGWYFSFMFNNTFINQFTTNDFSLFDAWMEADEDGKVSGLSQQPQYTGETATLRGSALFGVALRVAGPVYLRIGAGAGIRHYGWKTTSGTSNWVIIDPNSWKNAEGSLGLQCCIYNFVLNADALIPLDVLTEKKSTVEFRAGIGFCLRHKNSKR